MIVISIIPQQRIRLWGLQSVKQRRGDRGFGSRFPDSVRDVCALDCRDWIWREAARDRNSLFDGTCLFAQAARSNCAPGVRTQQSFCRNMCLCARREIQVCLLRENAAVALPEHVSLRTERDPSVLVACERSSLAHEHVLLLAHGERCKCACGVRTQQSFRWNMSLCARSEIQLCGCQKLEAGWRDEVESHAEVSCRFQDLFPMDTA